MKEGKNLPPTQTGPPSVRAQPKTFTVEGNTTYFHTSK